MLKQSINLCATQRSIGENKQMKKFFSVREATKMDETGNGGAERTFYLDC